MANQPNPRHPQDSYTPTPANPVAISSHVAGSGVATKAAFVNVALKATGGAGTVALA